MKRKSNSLIECGLLLLCQAAAADERVARMDLEELEKTYWICYQQAAQAVVAEQRFDELTMQLCGSVSLDLQRRRFQGDFGLLHEWSLVNRPHLAGGPPYPPSPPNIVIRTPTDRRQRIGHPENRVARPCQPVVHRPPPQLSS